MKSLDEYKLELVGKVFGWLTVLDVYRSTVNTKYRICLCQCKCGVIKEVGLTKVISGHTKSCGCYKRSDEMSKKVSDWYKNNPDKVKEKSEQYKQWCKDNPEKLAEQGKKYSKWCESHSDKVNEAANKRKQLYKEHPEILIKRGKKYAQWCKDNHDKVKQIGIKRSKWLQLHVNDIDHISKTISEWYKNNPDKIKEKVLKYKQWCKEHPEILKEKGERFSQWCKDNPDKVKDIGNHVSEYYRDHPDKAAEIGNNISTFNKQIRLQSDVSELIKIIHHDYINDLLNGNIKYSDKIKTKCPECGEYDTHDAGNVFMYRKSKLKLGHAPLCSSCRAAITSSFYEQEIYDYILTFYNGECVRNSRSVISPLELDLYFPEKKIAVEFNGDYWHNSDHKSKDYHYNKYIQCKNLGITLVSIFENEWVNNKHHIKSYLLDLFNDITNNLSFISSNIMNNNYPLPENAKITSEGYIEHCYESCGTVITCGYSYIVE